MNIWKKPAAWRFSESQCLSSKSHSDLYGHIVQVRAALRGQDRCRLDCRHLMSLRRELKYEVYGWTGKERWYKGQKLVCFISPALPDMQTIPSLHSEMASGWNGPAFMLLFSVLQSLAKRWGDSKSSVGEHGGKDINTPIQLFFPLKPLCDKF